MEPQTGNGFRISYETVPTNCCQWSGKRDEGRRMVKKGNALKGKEVGSDVCASVGKEYDVPREESGRQQEERTHRKRRKSEVEPSQ